jgi:endo-1,4-beta-xylanase
MVRGGGLSRRTVLGVMAGGLAPATRPSLATPAPADITAVPSLGALAATRGVLFGTAIDIDTLADPRRATLYRRHARILTTDNAMKFGSLRPQEGAADFTHADALVDFAARAGIPLRGHCLIWNEWQPDWVHKLSNARRAYWLDRHIDEVVGRYAGRLQSWDVVNEPFWPGHKRPGGFRNGPWFAALGPGYVIRALKRAQAADPTGRIAINEAGPEWEDVWGPSAPYRRGLLRLIDEAQHAGVRLDGVGLQCHWFPEFTFDPALFRGYLRELARRKVEITLSEIDVNDARFTGDTASRDAQVAARYTTLVTAALAEPAVAAIITWQLCDSASWLMGEPKLWGAPNRSPRPLPFDADLAPKAAYYALAKAFQSAR